MLNAKKFLKTVKHMCTDENCEYGKCPMAVKEENYTSCLMIASENIPDGWKIKKILKAVKKARKRKC